MKVALCIIATGRYTCFLLGLLETAAKHFFADRDTEVFLFVDEMPSPLSAYHPRPNSPTGRRLVKRWYTTPHEPWPGPTLHRYHTMLKAEAMLREFDYVYYLDVDSRFVRNVGEEICSDLVATIHFGYVDKPRNTYTYEQRPTSRACVNAGEGKRYYAGGFQGGRAAVYLEAMWAMAAAIDEDTRHGIVAVYHDESHWNRYLIDHPPTLELPHEYTCPDQWRPDTQRICIVGKNPGEWHK